MSEHFTDSQEIWKEISGYEGLYEASTHGAVRSLERKARCCSRSGKEFEVIVPAKLLEFDESNNGRFRVYLSKEGKRKRFSVHHLILFAFVGPRPEGMESCHFPDNNPKNNRLENLRWDTKLANNGDKKIIGTVACGEKHGMATMTNEEVIEIRRLWSIREHDLTISEFARRLGRNRRTISAVLNGQNWTSFT